VTHAGSIGASPHAAALQGLMADRGSSQAPDPTTVDSEFQRF
jgi:hypothetical protein